MLLHGTACTFFWLCSTQRMGGPDAAGFHPRVVAGFHCAKEEEGWKHPLRKGEGGGKRGKEGERGGMQV